MLNSCKRWQLCLKPQSHFFGQGKQCGRLKMHVKAKSNKAFLFQRRRAKAQSTGFSTNYTADVTLEGMSKVVHRRSRVKFFVNHFFMFWMLCLFDSSSQEKIISITLSLMFRSYILLSFKESKIIHLYVATFSVVKARLKCGQPRFTCASVSTSRI